MINITSSNLHHLKYLYKQLNRIKDDYLSLQIKQNDSNFPICLKFTKSKIGSTLEVIKIL